MPPAEHIPPPWDHPDFFTEEALRAVQEYYFQTHASNSRMIAEGRNATGVMKSGLRRKLSREIGEDFKMYTGMSVGGSAKASPDSMGIRGELNVLLENVYRKIAPGQPITSPAQEDLTILKHPLGALEVTFELVYFYMSLLKRYVTLAGNRRKVLKSVLDEELFKWIWRMSIGFLVSKNEEKLNFTAKLSSTGVNFIPRDKQNTPTADKLLAIGDFLLGKTLAESELRFPLAYYFVTFIKQIQYQTLALQSTNSEMVYEQIHSYVADQPVEDILASVDILINMRGNSKQAFDDILKNADTQASNYIPEGEIDFILQFQEFTEEGVLKSLEKFVPQAKHMADLADQGNTLMPLLLIMRTMPHSMRNTVLYKIPGPFLGLLINRISHGKKDDADDSLLTHINDVMDKRQKSGESYTVVGASKGKSKSDKIEKASSEVVEQTVEEVERAKADLEKKTKARRAQERAKAVEESAATKSAVLDTRLIVAWQIDSGVVSLTSVSARELITLVGPDPRFLRFWVVFALQTGQVFKIPSDKINKEVLTKILHALIQGASKNTMPKLSKQQRQKLMDVSKKSGRAALLGMCQAIPLNRSQQGGALTEGIEKLSTTVKYDLEDLIANPADELFQDIRRGLGEPEQMALRILNRVARFS